MKKILLNSVLALLCFFFASESIAGPKWELGDDSWMKLSFLGQAHFAHQDDTAPENDFYLRRGRFILTGQILDGVKFFVETDNDNAGKSGKSVSTDIQDAFVDVRLGNANSTHWVKGGLVLLPFSLETFSSAASLLGLDYNSETIKLTNTFVWRDYGVSIHGDFNKKLAYRVGAFDGYDIQGGSKNPDAGLRLTGHVALAVIGEVETGWFYTQDKLGRGNYLTIGTGFDRQDEATSDGAMISDSDAWVVDFQSSVKLGDTGIGAMDLTLNGAYYDWDNANFKGSTSFAETGLRAGRTTLTLKYTIQDPDGGESISDTTVGIHYFLKGHNVRGGVEYRTGDRDDMVLVGVQFLL